MDSEVHQGLNRRRFLAFVGLGGAAAGLLAACSSQPATPPAASAPTSAPAPTAPPAAATTAPTAAAAATTAPAGAATTAPAAGATQAPAQAASSRPLTPTYYSWITDEHTAVKQVTDDFSKNVTPVNLQIAPVEGFGIDRFVAEGKDKNSTWDVYVGMTPFVEMTALVQADVIEPWDPYIPQDVLNDILPSVRQECTIDGKLYCWPFLLDVIVSGSNTGLTSAAGTDPLYSNWDDYIAASQKVEDSKAAPYGCTFDAHGWRSLAPFTHSMSTQTYTSDNLFDFTSDPAVAALQLMKKMTDLSGPDVLNPGNTDAGVNDTPDENMFAAQKVAYYCKYQNAHIRFAATWPDPTKLALGPLPKFANGEGATVFWDTGAALFKYGQNKDTAAQYMKALTYDTRIWQESIGGGRQAVGQLPSLQSLWASWNSNRPSWMQDYAFKVFDQLKVSKAIPNHKYGLTQFSIGQQYWERYLKGETSDPKEALQAAKDAVQAEIQKTG